MESKFNLPEGIVVNAPQENKDRSVMAAVIPAEHTNEEYSFEKLTERLKGSSWFKWDSLQYDEGKALPVVLISYREKLYSFTFYVAGYKMNEIFRLGHRLSEENINRLEKATLAVSVDMYFSDEPLISYHLQLKILQTLVPEQIGVADNNSFNLLSPLWVQLTAGSLVPPCPDYLYVVHAVRDEKKGWFPIKEKNKKVWLHTHGLDRCGFPELEILNSTVSGAENHYSLLNHMAKRSIMDRKIVEEMEPLFLGQTMSQFAIVTTWVHWEKVIDSYKNMLGGRNDRRDDHNGNSGIIYIYPSEKDCENKEYKPVTIIPDNDYENLMVMFTDEETERMSILARERLPYLIKGLGVNDSHALVKMRIPVDEELKEEANTDWEHIWFEVKQIEDDKITATLVQQAYYFNHIKEGDTITLNVSELTDWMLYLNNVSIGPDQAYLLVDL